MCNSCRFIFQTYSNRRKMRLGVFFALAFLDGADAATDVQMRGWWKLLQLLLSLSTAFGRIAERTQGGRSWLSWLICMRKILWMTDLFWRHQGKVFSVFTHVDSKYYWSEAFGLVDVKPISPRMWWPYIPLRGAQMRASPNHWKDWFDTSNGLQTQTSNMSSPYWDVGRLIDVNCTIHLLLESYQIISIPPM